MDDSITKKISRINYAGISPDQIRKMSAIKVITPDTYDDEGYPIEKGLMDQRMGVIEPGLRCKTCGRKVNECVGHFGHVELARPVIHVGFVRNILNLLEITCSHCGRLLFDPEQIKGIIESRNKTTAISARLELKFIRSLSKKLYGKSLTSSSKGKDKMAPVLDILTPKHIVCPYCHAEQKKYKLDKPTTFREVESSNKLTSQEIREWLERITDDDLRCIGIDPDKFRPEWMVLTVLPVPPVTVRPSITLDSGERSEDDLTHKLVDIIRINERLRENRDAGAPQLIVEDLWELLQYHITTYFDNQTSGIMPSRHRSGRALKTLVQRLKGKEGRFRSNLSGKRVNFSARTVISPDPLLSINEVGVPSVAARELTVPLYVNDVNIELCRAYVRKGIEPVQIIEPKDIELLRNAGYHCVGFNPETGETDHEYADVFRNSDVKEFEARTSMVLKKKYTFGINYILRPDGRTLRVNDKNCMELANIIDTNFRLSRQLIDGDVVLFNRQPSLHRMSIMAHRVRVMGGRTFRFNLCVCPPYNADFDGDEMNLHVLQSEEARAEARIIMQVQENILSPRYGGPIIGAIHDHITGAYFLTHENPRFNRQDAMQILAKLDNIKIPDPMVDEGGNKYFTGKQLFTIILPKPASKELKDSIEKISNEIYDAICLEHEIKQISNSISEDKDVKKAAEKIANVLGVDKTGYLRGRIKNVLDMEYGTADEFRNAVSREISAVVQYFKDAIIEVFVQNCENDTYFRTSVPEKVCCVDALDNLRELILYEVNKTLNLKYKAAICHGCSECKRENCEYGAYVKIQDGQLVCGTIDVKGIGNSKGKILDNISRDYGSARGAQFINEVTRLVLGAISNRGFSTGIDDEDIPREASLQIMEHNKEKIAEVEELIRSYHEGTLEQMPGRTLKQTLEVCAKKTLEEARNMTGEIAGKHLGMKNPAVIMAKTGARGNMLNLSQMAGCVGQQSVRGERIIRGYRGRTLSHFKRGDLGAYAKGFVAHSYKDGLSPTEFFFHAMGGREGLVDTAVRTSKSGYLQRKFVSGFTDLKLMSDYSVKDSDGTIIQFLYGEDGADPAKAVKGNIIDMNDLFIEVFGDDADKFLQLSSSVDLGDGEATTETMEMDDDENNEDAEEQDNDNEGGVE